MLRLIGIMIAVGLADSLNPSTMAPALYIASQPRARNALAQFTAGVFTIYFLGGALIALGPGQLILSLVPRPDPTARHVLESLAGVVLLVAAGLLWVHRDRLGARQLPVFTGRNRAHWLLGASIMAIELPTAFPYFGALTAVIGSGVDVPRRLFLIGLFNVCFVMPQLAMMAALTFAGDHAQEYLGRASAFLRRHWPVLLAVVAVVAGLITIALGATGTYRVARRLIKRAVRAVKRTVKAAV
ncbi:GAP family protein [Conexibacter sp. S30A1]|jgi:hypothetical protein|uniref:GAP family protein n=1 Tax=Conexibacter sp. S30A1 TaxID=2937800 RepID=UPI00200BB4DB|nr:GAP family protein [Conexibacter sp. S30A1]